MLSRGAARRAGIPSVDFGPGGRIARRAGIPSVGLGPGGGHARLMERFRRRLHPSLRLRGEVPLPDPGDRRAWDGVVEGDRWKQPVEFETVIDDTQAVERRLTLKLRDGGFEHLILVVADTPRNRRALAAASAAFARFDVPARDALAALGAGKRPAGSALVLL